MQACCCQKRPRLPSPQLARCHLACCHLTVAPSSTPSAQPQVAVEDPSLQPEVVVAAVEGALRLPAGDKKRRADVAERACSLTFS